MGIALHLHRIENGTADVLVHIDLEPDASARWEGREVPQIAAQHVVRRSVGDQHAAAAAGIVSHFRWQPVSDHHIGSRVWPVVPDIEIVLDLSSRRDGLLGRHDHLLADLQIGLVPRLAGGGGGRSMFGRLSGGGWGGCGRFFL